MKAHPSRPTASTLGTHGQAAQGGKIREELISRVNVFTGPSPPAAHHRDSGYTGVLPLTERPHYGWSTEYFRCAPVSTGLGSPAWLYQPICHIATRSFYETPGAILVKNTFFWLANHNFAGQLCIDRHAVSGYEPGRCSCPCE